MLDEHENILDKVSSTSNSKIFHIQIVRESVTGRRTSTSCGAYRVRTESKDRGQMGLQEAIDRGMRPCKQCIKHLDRVHNVDCAVCDLCNRLSLVHDVSYFSYTLDYTYGKDKEVDVCLNCKIKVQD
jgi:hypothetical protein